MSEESGYFSEEDYSDQIDKILDMYETAAKNEKYYLFQSVFPVQKSSLELQCGLSPARTFSSVIILRNQSQQISFSTYEWADIMDILRCLQKEFFVPTYVDDGLAAPLQCGDFVHISRVIYEGDVKQVMIMKHLRVLYLEDHEVSEILKMDLALLTPQINLLEDLHFSEYYANVLEIVRNWLISNKTILSIDEILYAFSETTSNNSMLGNALKQYLFYYKEKILNDFNI